MYQNTAYNVRQALIYSPGVSTESFVVRWELPRETDDEEGIWLVSGSAHCRGIVMHKGRHVYCVLSVLRVVPPPFLSASPSSL